MAVNPGSAIIGGRFDLAKPDIAVDGGPGRDLVIAHLTQGLNKADPEKSGGALRIDGQVEASFGASGPPPGFEVAFLQFVRFNSLFLSFAGRSRTEGFVVLSAIKAFPKTVLLDPNKRMPPWMSEQKFTQVGKLVKNSMGDHPFLQSARQLPNFTTGLPNFIFRLIDDRDFWSVFSARDGAGKFQHLMHIHWHVRHSVTFRWRGGVPEVASNGSAFAFDSAPTRGAPAEQALAALLAAPAGPNANDEMKAALLRAAARPPNPFRNDEPAWPADLPGDFFRA